MKKLAVVVIAKNEEERIADCLSSVSFCDQIFVIDNNSTDNTTKIAKEMGAKIMSFASSDFSQLRNEALKVVDAEWILYIDADERVSETLAKEIEHTVSKENQYGGYRLLRTNFYLGNNRWPKQERLERLFRKSSLKKWYGTLHESPRVEGTIGDLQGELYHYTHRTLSEMVLKTLEWSKIEAKLRYDHNHPPVVWWRFPRVMATGFLDSYIRQGGWKVGTVGLIESMYQGFSMFMTYARLWELQQNRKHKTNT